MKPWLSRPLGLRLKRTGYSFRSTRGPQGRRNLLATCRAEVMEIIRRVSPSSQSPAFRRGPPGISSRSAFLAWRRRCRRWSRMLFAGRLSLAEMNTHDLPASTSSSNRTSSSGVHLLPRCCAGIPPLSHFLLGLTPSRDDRPKVSRRCVTDPDPRSGRPSNISSEASRTSPTVLKPAPDSAF
jgi:hypothetical protein